MTQAVRTKGAIVNFMEVVIPASSTVSNKITVAGRIVSIHVPSDSTATSLSFRSSSDVNGTFVDIQDSTGSVLSIVVAANTEQYVVLEPAKFVGVKHLQLVSDAAMGAGGDVTFKIGVAELT